MDISSLSTRGKLRRAVPVGPTRADDTVLTATGTVYEIDAAGGRVHVGIRGGDVWLPAVAARYSTTSLARVLLDPTSSRPVMVLGPVTPRAPSELGGVTATGSGDVTVDVAGTSYTIPAPLGTYTVGQSAWVLLDDWGTPILALGPSTVTPAPGGGGTAPGGGGATVTATATIGPQVSGTWRASMSRWDSWNVGRYGLGQTPVYQGDAYGSGPLAGFLGYGDQIVNLGAVSIESITSSAKKGDPGSAVLTVQGSASGGRPAGAPSSAGDTSSTAAIASGGSGSFAFTAPMCEAFRTGAAKGLVAVGSQYGGFGGFGVPGSFVLQIQYTKNV